MEAVRMVDRNDRMFFVLFSKGFSTARAKMIEETGGDEQYCVDALRQIGGGKSMSQAELVSELAYYFTFPEKFQTSEVKNLALLGAWLYWLKGIEAEDRLDVLNTLKQAGTWRHPRRYPMVERSEILAGGE